MKLAFWKNLFQSGSIEVSQNILTLKQAPLFGGLSDHELIVLSKIVHNRKYDIDEFVFKSGMPAMGMYIILKGQVVLNGINTDGNQVEFSQLSAGDSFGEISLISENNRIANAVAVSSCELVAFSRSDLIDLIVRSPKLGNKILLNLATILGSRLIQNNQLLI